MKFASPDRFDVMRPDTLLFILGGFAEPQPTWRDERRSRLARLRQLGVSNAEIGDCLGVKACSVATYARKLGLPPRSVGRSRRT